MSKYNVGDVVRIASAETIKERGRCGLGAVAPPYGFHWHCTFGMFEYCGTLHEIERISGGAYHFADIPCMWEDWMLDDDVPEIHMSIEEVFE